MADSNEKRSVTIRLDDEPILAKWIAAQDSPVSSIKAAIKMCIYKYGNEKDLVDAVIMQQFATQENQNSFTENNSNINRRNSDNNNTALPQNAGQNQSQESDKSQTFANSNQHKEQPENNNSLSSGMASLLN